MKNISRFHALALRASIVATLAVFTLPSFAQNVVQEDGNTIEFIGLKKWTIQQLTDSVRKYDSKGKLGFCAATLKSNLKFCDASVIWLSKDSLAITVIEPQDSLLVKRNAYFPGNVYLSREWGDFQEAFAYKVFEKGLAIETQFSTNDSATFAMREYIKKAPSFVKFDSTAFQNIRTALRTNPIPVERLTKVIRSNWDAHSRGVAALAMTRFPDNDTCLQSVLYAMNDIGASTTIVNALEYFSTMLKYRTREIALAPLYNELRPLVNGSNLFAYHDILKLIAMGKPTEKDFRIIFADEQSRHLLFAHLKAASPYPRLAASKLITTLNPKFAALSEAEQKKYLNIR
jgi:hypothetical protein